MTSTPDSSASGPPAVKPRRSHTKTRTGCVVCKRRKIKCGEEKPYCRNCLKRGETCRFTDLPLVFTPPATPPSPNPNMVDLELLHHFTTSTYATLTDNPLVRDLWRIRIVKLCFSCDYAMLALLSVSALHLERFCLERRDFLRDTALIYHENASRIATALMDNLDEKNCDGLFAFSVLTVYFGFAGPRGNDSWCPPPWMVLIRGCRSFIMTFQTQVSSGLFSPMMTHSRHRLEAREKIAHVDYLQHLQLLLDQSVMDPERRSIYNSATEILNKSFGMFYEDPYQQDLVDIFYWILIAEDIIPLLANEEQEALVLLAYFCVLLNRIPNKWWIEGWVEYLMTGIYGALDEAHRGWIIWPIEELGWVPSL